MLWQFVVYLLCGIALDAVITLQQKAVYKHQPLLASILSIIIVLISTLIVVRLVKGDLVIPMIAYAIGCGLGTWIGMKVGPKSLSK